MGNILQMWRDGPAGAVTERDLCVTDAFLDTYRQRAAPGLAAGALLLQCGML